MHCFYHRDVEAIGSCKNCARGLCPECAAEVENGLACRSRCEAEVAALNRVIARNKTAYQKASGTYLQTAVFYVLLGAVFLAAGVLNWHGMGWFLLIAAAICLAGGLLHFATSRKYERD
jgi:Flp pilus assembly protein TadB